MQHNVINGHCLSVLLELKSNAEKVDLTFLDPPFNQQKDYRFHHDDMDEKAYWQMMKEVCLQIFQITNEGGYAKRKKHRVCFKHT